jgi:hypothetical protein
MLKSQTKMHFCSWAHGTWPPILAFLMACEARKLDLRSILTDYKDNLPWCKDEDSQFRRVWLIYGYFSEKWNHFVHHTSAGCCYCCFSLSLSVSVCCWEVWNAECCAAAIRRRDATLKPPLYLLSHQRWLQIILSSSLCEPMGLKIWNFIITWKYHDFFANSWIS